jgi:hypothetical protein
LKKILIIIISSLLFIGVTFVGVILLNKVYYNSEEVVYTITSSSESAQTLSNKYQDTDYGDSKDIEGDTITSGGSYTITGSHENIIIDAEGNVELILNNANISNNDGPAIYVKNAKTVSIVLIGTNTITSNTTEELDGSIYSKSDLIISGSGTLKITSNIDGIVSKDSLIINSGTYIINSEDDAIRGKDFVAIVDGVFTIDAGGDAIKSTNDEDSTLGYIAIDSGTFNIICVNDGIDSTTEVNIKGGSFNITTTSKEDDSSKCIKGDTKVIIKNAKITIDSTDDGIHSNGDILIAGGNIIIDSGDDAVHADGMLNITGGSIDVTAHEGLEATYVKIDGGTITINATDDGINAGNKSSDYSVKIEITGGDISINMGSGDTDAVDSNGDLVLTGGTINITARSPFDYDGTLTFTNTKVIVNGEETKTITNQMMGGRNGRW